MYQMKKIMILLFIVLIELLAGSVAAESDGDHWLCRVVNAAYYGPEVAIGEWDTNPAHYGWINIPDSLFEQDPIILYTDELMTSGYVLYIDGEKMYVFPHWSFLVRADSSGAHGGTHDFCSVLIYTLGER
jgi:hypothetical protein